MVDYDDATRCTSTAACHLYDFRAALTVPFSNTGRHQASGLQLTQHSLLHATSGWLRDGFTMVFASLIARYLARVSSIPFPLTSHAANMMISTTHIYVYRVGNI